MKIRLYWRIGIIAVLTTMAYAKKSESLEPPNVILVMTDDQGYGDLGCHGHPYLKTPHLNKLYAQSVRFTDFHVSSTCSPTRAALMSGRHPFKNGVTHTILERERMSLSSTTIAQVLKLAGYTTGIFGKWHLGDADAYQPDQRGFDEVFIHGNGAIGSYLNFSGTQQGLKNTHYFSPLIKHNGTFVKTRGFCTDVFFTQALSWIKKNKDKRFFAYIPTNVPHLPWIVAQKYTDDYKGKCPDDTANFYGSIANFDENMGRLMAKLDHWRLSKNTILIFMTDNGTSGGYKVYNAKMKGWKGSVNEGGSRVPLFIRWPAHIRQGYDVERLTRHYDIFPTLAHYTKAKIPAEVKLDGRNLSPIITNPNAEWSDRYTFFHSGRWQHKDADYEKEKYRNFAIRNEKWRLVNKTFLYDINKDPGEKNNVAKTHPEVVAEMMKVYDQWWSSVRPLMINENANLKTDKPFRERFAKQKKEKGIPEWKPYP